MRPVVLGAVALTLAVTPIAAAAQVKWVPLNKVERGPKKKPVAATPTAAPQMFAAPETATLGTAPTAPTIDAPPTVATVPTATVGNGSGALQITCFGGGTANKAA